MARVSHIQNTFHRGEISEKLWKRSDLELYYSSLKTCENFVVDGRGILEKRPGTRYITNTADDDEVVLYPFQFSPTQSYVLAFGDGAMRAFLNYAPVLTNPGPGQTVFELAVPWDVTEAKRFSYVQSNDTMFIADGQRPINRILRLTANSFGRSEMELVDGPYEEPNAYPDRELTMASGTLTATGFAPFTANMVGRWVRMMTPNTESENPEELGDEFLWAYFQITAFVSATEVETNHIGGDIEATPDWRLGLFYGPRQPSKIAIHQGRLVVSYRNAVYFSRAGDLRNFGPTRQVNIFQIGTRYTGEATLEVQPGNGIAAIIDVTFDQQGSVETIQWMRSLNFQLLVGTTSGLLTVQSSSLGEAITPDNIVMRPQDARPVAGTHPVSVSESVLFAHATGKRLQASYYRQSYDRIGAQDLSLPADTMMTDRIRQIAWQDYPHGIVWMCLEDGHLRGFTLQPEEQVQAWHRHRLGGRFIANGRIEHPRVESVCVVPSPDGQRSDLWLSVARTVNDEIVRFIEVMQPFWEKGQDVRDGWFLDAARKYEPVTNPGQQFRPLSEFRPDAPALLLFPAAPGAVGAKLSLHDSVRWHRGTILELEVIDPSNIQVTFQPAAPNAPANAPDGSRWFWVPQDEEWHQFADDGSFFHPTRPIYQPPIFPIPAPGPPPSIFPERAWSIGVTSMQGLDYIEGETVHALLDGIASLDLVVDGGEVAFDGEVTSALVGLRYESKGAVLSIEAGSQSGTAEDKQRPVYERSINVWETWGLEVGSGQMSSYRKTWEHYEKVVFESSVIEGEPPLLFEGFKRISGDGYKEATDPQVAFRHREPYPCFIRAIVARVSTSDGR